MKLKADQIIQVHLMKKIMEMPHFEFVKTTPGDLMSRIFDMKEAYTNFFIISFLKLPTIFIFCLLAFNRLFGDQTIQYSAVFIIYPIIFVSFIFSGIDKTLLLNQIYCSEKKKNAADLLDKIQNFEVIKSFNTQENEADDFYMKLEKEKNCQFNLKRMIADKRFFLSFFAEIPFIIILVIINSLNYAKLTPLLLILKDLNKMLFELGYLINKLALSINHIIDQKQFEECENIDLSFNDKISFHSISIYHDDHRILSDVSFDIKKGEKVVIVGENGTGKSSLIKSLIKFSAFKNEICIDTVDVAKVSSSSLFKLISYVSQDNYIANDTVLSNIRIGNKAINENSIEKLASFLGFEEFFNEFKNGLDTEVGVSGALISAGQRQKISLLRALAKETPIIILDEATSSLDKTFEESVVKKLTKLKDKTLIMIIHQKNLIQYFDKIIFLKGGSVSGSGSYTELIHSNEDFKNFINN